MPFGVELALLLMAIRATLWLGALGFVMQRLLGVSARLLLWRWRLPVLGVAMMVLAIVLSRSHTAAGWTSLLVLTAAGALAYAGTLAVGLAFGDRHLMNAAQAMRAR